MFVVVGIVLLLIGYSIFFGSISPFYPFFFWRKQKELKGKPGSPQVCPICSTKLIKKDIVKSFVFPSEGRTDRLMYIRGCYACLEESAPRKCPICKTNMSLTDYLIARMFERSSRKSHIHVLGCNKCRIGNKSMK
jgi:hypothetical protein